MRIPLSSYVERREVVKPHKYPSFSMRLVIPGGSLLLYAANVIRKIEAELSHFRCSFFYSEMAELAMFLLCGGSGRVELAFKNVKE